MKPTKNPAAVALGRLGGKAGTGKSKARKLTSKQAKQMAAARWKIAGKVASHSVIDDPFKKKKEKV